MRTHDFIEVRACGILFDRQAQSILLHRKLPDKVWALPGGKLELGELASEAVVREFAEELAINVTAQRLLWVVENRYEHEQQAKYQVGFYFLTSLSDFELEQVSERLRTNDASLEFKWFSKTELEDIEFRPVPLKADLFAPPTHVVHLTV